MEDNAVEDDDIDFSIISPGNEKHKQLDFSVNELLTNPKTKENKQQSIQPQACEEPDGKPEGSFLRDLGKLEQQISYQTNPYDIYQPSQQPGQFTHTGEGKQEDTCTKTINNMTKLLEKFGENDFKHLILDFTDQKACSNLKTKQSFEDYFQGSILKTKKIAINSYQKITDSKPKVSAQSTFRSNSKLGKLSNKLKSSQKQHNLSKKKTQQRSKIHSQSSKKSISTDKNKTPKNSLNKLPKSKSRQNIGSKQKKLLSHVYKNTTNRQQSQVYSQYYGFDGGETLNKKNKNRSNSKGKKIIFSKKNVHV